MKKAIFTFFIGSIGGGIAYFLSLPIPWLLGSLLAVSVMQFSTKQMAPPHKVFSRWIRVVIGVALGASVADSLDEISASIFSTIIIALVFVVLITTFGYWFFNG